MHYFWSKKKHFTKYGYRNKWNDDGSDSKEIKTERISTAFIWDYDLSYIEFHFVALTDGGVLKSQLFIK